MHESTVSRVTSGEVREHPHGIFGSWKYFFTSGLNREGGGGYRLQVRQGEDPGDHPRRGREQPLSATRS